MMTFLLNNQTPYTVMWPIREIKENEGMFRDFLAGYDEATSFRSTRLQTWFETPEDYYMQQLQMLRSSKPTLDAEQTFQTN
jgi:hypothetical protein